MIPGKVNPWRESRLMIASAGKREEWGGTA